MAGELQVIRQRDLDQIKISVGENDQLGKRRKSFLQLVALGVPTKHAAARAFIKMSTVRAWCNVESASFDPYFHDLLRAARAEAVVRRVRKIDADEDWKAHAFLLQGVAEEFAPKRAQPAVTEDTTKKSGRIVIDAATTKALSIAYDKARAEREQEKAHESQEANS